MPWKNPKKSNHISNEIDKKPEVGSKATLPRLATKSESKTNKSGLEFEKELLYLLRACTSYAWKLPDTRLLGKTSKHYIGPKVHSDMEAIIVGRTMKVVKSSRHIHVEAKSTRNDTLSYKMWDMIFTAKKEHQWNWTKLINENVEHELAFYAIENRIHPGAWYILIMGWNDLKYWMDYMLTNKKKSVQWTLFLQHTDRDKVLLQTPGDTTDKRFVNPDNIAKLKKFMGVHDWEIEELEYPWT